MFGKDLKNLTEEERPVFWLKFFGKFDKHQDFLDPRVIATFFTDPLNRSIKKQSASVYYEIEPWDSRFLESIQEELNKGLWIEGIRGTLTQKDKTKLHIYMIDYKSRTTFSLVKRPAEFTLEKEIQILADLFGTFTDFASSYLSDLPFQQDLQPFLQNRDSD